MEYLNDYSLFLLSLNRFCYDVGRVISKKFRLTVNERNILIILSYKNIKSVKEISQILSLSKTNTSKVLRSLEKKSLIVRIFNKNDKRYIQILLTEKGKLTANLVAEEINEILKKRLSDIPNEVGAKILNFIESNPELIPY
jgi:DNA-binding MarR family transcriptional regulator